MRKRLFYWGALAMMFGLLLFINWWCIPAHDELGYTFQGECTPIVGEAHHIENLGDIVRSEIAEYSHGPSGRVFLHAFVQLFAGWELYHFFDVCNTIAWFILVWLVLTEAKVRLSLRSYTLGAAVLMWFYYYAETCTFNMAFSINYLWFSCVTILFLRAWRKYEAWWMVVLAFFFGWGQEAFSLTVLAGVGFCGFVQLCRAHKYPWSVKRTLTWFSMLLGIIGCCGSHFLSGRVSEPMAGGFIGLLIKLAKQQSLLLMFIWPFVLIVLIGLIVWFNRGRFDKLFAKNQEWWAIFLFGYLEYFLLADNAFRIVSPMLLAGIILLLSNHEHYRVLVEKLSTPCIVAAVVWLMGAAVLQYDVGHKLKTALSIYYDDPQGITYREPTVTGPWGPSVAEGRFNIWHRCMFRHQVKKPNPPVFLSKRLYETLYLNPSKFFECADEVIPGGYVLPGEERYVVCLGDGSYFDDNRMRMCEAAINRRAASVGWRRFLPGRIRVWVPASDLHVGIPTDPFTLRAADGNYYSLVAPYQK